MSEKVGVTVCGLIRNTAALRDRLAFHEASDRCRSVGLTRMCSENECLVRLRALREGTSNLVTDTTLSFVMKHSNCLPEHAVNFFVPKDTRIR